MTRVNEEENYDNLIIPLKTGRFVLHEQLNEPNWAGVVALILVLPLIVVPIMRYLWPRVTGIKIYSFLELTLTPQATDEFAKRFQKIEIEAGNSLVVIGDKSSEIIQMIKEFENSKKEAIVVNLMKGDEWHVTNLYFLTFLVERQRLVDQIVIVESGLKDNEFIAMCTPDELLTSLEIKFPEYARAKHEFQKNEVIPPQQGVSPGKYFFDALQTEWNKPGARGNNRIWLNSRILAVLVGNYLHTQHLVKREQFTEIDYRYIINNRYPYTAIEREKE